MTDISALFRLDGQTALVTGASRGLGKAIALALASSGARVICSSSTVEGAADTVAAIQAQGGEAIAVAADLADEASVRALAAAAIARPRSATTFSPSAASIAPAATSAAYEPSECPRK